MGTSVVHDHEEGERCGPGCLEVEGAPAVVWLVVVAVLVVFVVVLVQVAQGAAAIP